MPLLNHISRLGNRPFLIREGRAYTYADLLNEIRGASAFLTKNSVKPGQVVVMEGCYGFRAAAFFFALAENRNIVAPLVGAGPVGREAAVDAAGAEWIVGISEPGHFLCDVIDRKPGREQPVVRSLADAGRAGLILFSSGTTGRPKAMLHDLDRLMESYPPRPEPRDSRVLAFMGIDHIGGIDIFLRAVAGGSTLVVPAERAPEAVCQLIAEHRIDVLPATPTFLNLLLVSEAYRRHDLSSLKIVGFGAESMPPRVLARLREIFPDVDFQQKFGTSETNAVRMRSKSSGSLWMRIDDENVEWKILDGELWLKSRTRILGYLNAENNRLTDDGWFQTGDLVEEDDEDFFRIAGRVEEVINVGGEKVLPAEVEAVVREVASVLDCRAFGDANPLMGQTVAAEVVLENGVDAREAVREIRRHCRQRLAPYKVPVKIDKVEKLEMTERGKRRIFNH